MENKLWLSARPTRQQLGSFSRAIWPTLTSVTGTAYYHYFGLPNTNLLKFLNPSRIISSKYYDFCSTLNLVH